MATYTAGCSAVGGYSYAGNFTLYVVLNDRDGNPNTNKSYVDYNVYCQSNGAGSISANHFKYFIINGEEKVNETVKINASSPNAYISIASGTIEVEHNTDGTKTIGFSARIVASSYGVSANLLDQSFTLNPIPRYTNFTDHYVESTGLNSITVYWNATNPVDYLRANVNEQGWFDLAGWPRYSLTDLAPNTTYSIRTAIRRADSGLWTESGTIYGTTKDIARVTSAPNINLGDTLLVRYSNPSGANLQIGLFKTDGVTPLAGYRPCYNDNCLFIFTDEELDYMYKQYGNGNSITARVYLKTNDTYLDYSTITINLTGNQKSGHIKLSNEWKRTKRWKNINGTWRQCVRWKNINGTWHRCI